TGPAGDIDHRVQRPPVMTLIQIDQELDLATDVASKHDVVIVCAAIDINVFAQLWFYLLGGSSSRLWSMPDLGPDRCDGHHEMVDLKLTKKAPLRDGTPSARIFVFLDPAPAITSSGGAVVGCDQFGGKTVQLARLARASIFDDQVLPDT